VGTNDLRQTGNLDYVMGDIYDLVNMAKTTLDSVVSAPEGRS
jgi:hypothetical protein